MESVFSELLQALLEEESYARTEHHRIASLSYEDRIALGLALPPMMLYRHEDPNILFKSKHLLHEGIEAGDLVIFFPIGAEQRAIEGLCTDIEDGIVEIRSREAKECTWLNSGAICIQKIFDDRSYQRQKQGLQKAAEHQSPLKKCLLGNWNIIQPQTSPNISTLNQAQNFAFASFFCNPHLSIIHGPPGTGKTHTIAQIVLEVLKQKQRPWALADSNAAVDNLCLSLEKANIDVLRMGSRFRISPQTWHLSLYARLENHPQQPAVRTLEKEIRTSQGTEKAKLVREKRALLRSMRTSIIEAAPVIASTLSSMAKDAPDLRPSDVSIIDEASQATDPAIWSIIPYTQKLLLVGDPYQLGPVVLSHNTRLKKTLLAQKMKEQDCPMLRTQHRMNERIMRLVTPIYGEQYTAHPSVQHHKLCDLSHVREDPLCERALLWMDTCGAEEGEQRDPVTRSLYNPTEIDLAISYAQHLRKIGVQDIAIITPYSAQVQRLKQRTDIDVYSVTSFQGQEREVIIASFVRANFDGTLGFVADEERLTVSLTRARRLWIGIGDTALLSGNKRFSDIFAELEAQEALVSIWDEPLF